MKQILRDAAGEPTCPRCGSHAFKKKALTPSRRMVCLACGVDLKPMASLSRQEQKALQHAVYVPPGWTPPQAGPTSTR